MTLPDADFLDDIPFPSDRPAPGSAPTQEEIDVRRQAERERHRAEGARLDALFPVLRNIAPLEQWFAAAGLADPLPPAAPRLAQVQQHVLRHHLAHIRYVLERLPATELPVALERTDDEFEDTIYYSTCAYALDAQGQPVAALGDLNRSLGHHRSWESPTEQTAPRDYVLLQCWENSPAWGIPAQITGREAWLPAVHPDIWADWKTVLAVLPSLFPSPLCDVRSCEHLTQALPAAPPPRPPRL